MPKNDSLFAEVGNEEPVFLDKVIPTTEDTTPAESQTENKSEDDLPFHRHPRWKAMREANERLESQLEEFQSQLESLQQRRESPAETTDLPDWWVERYGKEEDSVKGYKQYVKNNEELEQQIEQKILAKIEERNQQVEKLAQESYQDLDQQYDELVESGAKVEKNELFKFILDMEEETGVSISNGERYDLEKAYKLYQKMNPPKEDITEKKKNIAGLSMMSRGQVSRDNIPKVSMRQIRGGRLNLSKLLGE